MASASDHRAHAALQPADCLILLPQRLPAAVQTSIGPAHYPAECTQSDAFLQPSLRARKGRANSTSFCRLQISEFPTGDFGSNRQAVSVETDRPFRSKAAPRCEWVLVPALANRRCVIYPILLWPAKASTLVIIIVSNDCCGSIVN